MTVAQPPRTILVKFADGSQRKISGIPHNVKITYAKVNPASEQHSSAVPYALRIYRTANDQIAVFLNVVEFRDLSLSVEVRDRPTPVIDPLTRQVIAPEAEVVWRSEDA